VDLARLQAAQAGRQPLHLGQAGGAGGDGGGRPGDLVEQHPVILRERPTTGTRAGRAAAELARPRRVDIRVQVGASSADCGRALPYLECYYHGIRAVSEVSFDPRRAARLELEWWIVHREVDDHPPGDLETALAAELYQVPAERLWAHASRRAEAMAIRDHTSRREVGVLGGDWDRIEAVLRVAWKALADEVSLVRLEEQEAREV
jgi:hypothetical protein